MAEEGLRLYPGRSVEEIEEYLRVKRLACVPLTRHCALQMPFIWRLLKWPDAPSCGPAT